ncbi:hypothetical protein Fmac_018197 [Flemingia macrophylla]|uniref:Uncharacterized protein n=1 Tax=Flemingia macrophylla TaxID=520843 RepID=A0ABD1M4G6_9FABA
MHTMRVIINADIREGWTQFFHDRSPLPDNQLTEVRNIWSTFFIDWFKEEVDVEDLDV